jgi:hypothetical protein
MSPNKSEPFFTVNWEPPITPGLLPTHPSKDEQQFMTVAWKSTLGAVYYPFERGEAEKAR